MFTRVRSVILRRVVLAWLSCLPLAGAIHTTPALAAPAATPLQRVSVVSFNIQFLGLSKSRDNEALASLLDPFDLVIVQELVAPPYPGRFPDGTPYKPDPEAAAFFDVMKTHGFHYVLSQEDTGSGPKNHLNSSATEWFVAFYRPGAIRPAPDLYTGFLAEDRTDNPDFERVPYAFGFRAGSEDLVFISVHLQPGDGAADRVRRAHELGAVFDWIAERPGPEKDYVVLGDMNLADCGELSAVLPRYWESLNRTCLPTNTNVSGPKPYDHVMRRIDYTAAEIPMEFEVINLASRMRPSWRGPGPYPGDRKSTRLNSSHTDISRMPSSA